MTTLPAWARRLLTKELRFVAEGMEFDRAAAQKILPLLAPRRKNEKQRATQKRKLQGAAARRAASAELREAVLKREGPTCELGGHENLAAPLQMHHMEGGAGRRREKQWEGNCIRACGFCHAVYHRDPRSFIHSVKEWAARHNYPLPSIIRKAEASAELPGRAAR